MTYGGNVTVQAAGTLAGHGTVGGTVTNSGTVAPGGTIGTLTVSGNYTQGAGSTLGIEADAATSSELVVSGAAALAGTLALTFDPGVYVAGTQYTLVTAAGGVSGTFGALTEGGASIGLLTLSLSYQPDEVELTLLAGACSGAPVLDCEVPSNSTLVWTPQITATTLDLNTQSPNTGTLTLSALNNQQTSTNVVAGALSVSDPAQLGSAVGALTLGGTQAGGGATNGTLAMTTGITWAGSITTAGAGGTLLVAPGQTSTLSGSVTDAAGLTVGNPSNTGALTLSGIVGGAGGVTLGGGALTSAARTRTGGVTVAAAHSAWRDTNLGNAARTVTFNGGTLQIPRRIRLRPGRRARTAAAISPNAGTTVTLSGMLAGRAASRERAGDPALSGTNTFTGGVTVTSGTLSVERQ